ncbi:unnamed protein product [Coregonus sp. 'balchen']|nr:unnamed protein product [Coregonus sp. 'balchen']
MRDDKPVFEKRCLEELKAEHASYIRQHLDLRAMMADFLQFLLLRKPPTDPGVPFNTSSP